MKKISLILLSLLFVFTLASCVKDDPYKDNGSRDEPEDDIIIEVPGSILTLIEEDILESLSFSTISEDITGTTIVNIYVGKDDLNEEKFYAIRMEFMGRWDTVDFMVLIDKEQNQIVSLIIVEESENWGSFITMDSFLDQFPSKSVEFYLTNDVLLGIDGNSSATTTIGGINASLEEAINYYKNNLE